MTDGLELTGERLLPDRQQGELVYAEHMARYHIARRLCPGARVLDAACGEGYGTAQMAASGASSVVGVDVEPAAVEHARSAYGEHYQVADVARLPFADASFDLVVSFETIEHVVQPNRVLDEFARVLDADGTLLISTPNASKYVIENEFHHQEFELEDFVSRLRARFDRVEVLAQDNHLLSAIVPRDLEPCDEPLPGIEFVLDRATDHAEPLYLVALCSRHPVALPPAVAWSSGVHEAHELTAQVRGWQQRAFEAERVLQAWTERAEEAERVAQAWVERAGEAERQVREARERNATLTGSTSWRVTAPLRRVQEARERRWSR